MGSAKRARRDTSLPTALLMTARKGSDRGKVPVVAVLAPLRRFVAHIVALSDGWMVSRPADPRYAERAGEALASWAAAGALLGQVNQQGAYEREWTLGSLALAYLKMRDAPMIPAAQH